MKIAVLITFVFSLNLLFAQQPTRFSESDSTETENVEEQEQAK